MEAKRDGHINVNKNVYILLITMFCTRLPESKYYFPITVVSHNPRGRLSAPENVSFGNNVKTRACLALKDLIWVHQ